MILIILENPRKRPYFPFILYVSVYPKASQGQCIRCAFVPFILSEAGPRREPFS